MSRSIIPNTITCCNLICGCIATGAAFQGATSESAYFTAFGFILFGAFFDFFDGLAARSLGVSGKFGVQLDSLADVVTFGVAPSAMLFSLFTQVYYPEFMYNSFWFKFLPFTAFLVAAFSACRLAKFNIDERQHHSFIGMPTPANALLIVGIANSPILDVAWKTPIWGLAFLGVLIVFSSYMLVCELPMFSLKTPSKFPLIFAITSVVLTVTLFCLGLGLLGLTISMIGYILASVIMAKCCKA
jgi:CDP-diacylglycerol--serine O-phosphatidyltransferase